MIELENRLRHTGVFKCVSNNFSIGQDQQRRGSFCVGSIAIEPDEVKYASDVAKWLRLKGATQVEHVVRYGKTYIEWRQYFDARIECESRVDWVRTPVQRRIVDVVVPTNHPFQHTREVVKLEPMHEGIPELGFVAIHETLKTIFTFK
jgi:hypothetical protein